MTHPQTNRTVDNMGGDNGVTCIVGTFVLNQSVLLRMNCSAKKRPSQNPELSLTT